MAGEEENHLSNSTAASAAAATTRAATSSATATTTAAAASEGTNEAAIVVVVDGVVEEDEEVAVVAAAALRQREEADLLQCGVDVDDCGEAASASPAASSSGASSASSPLPQLMEEEEGDSAGASASSSGSNSAVSSPMDRSNAGTPERATSPGGEPSSSDDEVINVANNNNNNNNNNNKNEETKNDSSAAAEEDAAAVDASTEQQQQQPEQDQEVILIQDTSFTVKIQAPGVSESFELQVSSMELVQEIHQVLMDREDTCHRTCFSLYVAGRPGALDAFSELKTIPELRDGAVLHVMEEPYTIREARIHVRHVRDLLKSIDMTDAYVGHDGASLSVLNHLTGGDVTMTLPDTAKRRSRVVPDAVDCTPPETIMPGAKCPPLSLLHPIAAKECKGPVCLRAMALSGWNPPPGNRRLQGDLIYLVVVTAEDKKFHITSSTRGFYLNECTDDVFSPRPSESGGDQVFHSLVDLLGQISPLFRKNFAALTKRRVNKHPFERVATPYQVYTWLAPVLEHSVDQIRAEDAFSSKLGYEEHLPAQTRDWNEELQTTRELARKSLPDRLIRERAMFKVHSDFVMAATKGAMSVVDGNVMAINPGEDPRMQMYIWNNIFFSLGFDVKDHYKEFGGDAAAYSAPANDLQGVKAYSGVDMEGLYTLGTVVLDYRGFRVTAQSIIPGILDREQEQSVVYGSIDFGKTVVVDKKYQELLQKTAQALKIHPHRVLNDKNEPVELVSSIECKGIVGNDGRHYILDLLRTFPPDINFLNIAGEEVGAVSKEHGFPAAHRHKLVCLRQELIEAFVEARYVQFVKHAAMQFQQLRFKQQFIDKRLSMLRAEPEEKKEKADKIVELPDIEEEEEESSKSAAANSEKAAPSSPAAASAAAASAAAEAASLMEVGMEVIDVDAKKRGESEEREIKEAKKIVETLIPESTKLAGIKEAVLPPDCCSGGVCAAEEGGKAKEEIAAASAKAAAAAASPPSEQKEGCGVGAAVGATASSASSASTDKNEDDEDDASFERLSKDIVKRSARAVKSLKDNEFDIRFNPDIFQIGVRHAKDEEDLETYDKEKQLIKDAADFLLAYQIPSLIRDCLDHTSTPLDGITLTEAMHQRGINMRYLGKLAQRLVKIPQLDYFLTIVLSEILVRSAKHVFQTFLQSVPQDSTAAAVAKFLNCFLDSSCVGESPYDSPASPTLHAPHAPTGNPAAASSSSSSSPNAPSSSSSASSSKASKKKKGKKPGKSSTASSTSPMMRSVSSTSESEEWKSLSSAELWQKIVEDAESHFLWKFAKDESIDSFCASTFASRVSLLRNFCLKIGLQLQLRDYALGGASASAAAGDNGAAATSPTRGAEGDSSPLASPNGASKRPSAATTPPMGGARGGASASTAPLFVADDVLGMFPIVKHVNPKATDAYHFFTSGQAKVQQGLLKEGYELISEALNLLNNVYGAMHPEIAACLRLLARLNYIMGDYGEALCYQQKAVLMTERVLGLDHPHTITEYANLALYCFANGHVTSALKLFYRARYLALLCHGERHPEVALFDSNIGLILHAVGEFDLALKFLENALLLNRRYFGENSLKTALSCHFVARVQSCRGDFRSALGSEKETYAIYKSQLGEDHEKTRESSECLKHLTKQAVLFQKKMNEIYKGEKTASLPPIQVAPPSLSGVLELLNIINGILFVHVSQKELDSLRTEIKQQQQQQQQGHSQQQQQQQQAAAATTVVPTGGAGGVQTKQVSSKATSQQKIAINNINNNNNNNNNVKSESSLAASNAEGGDPAKERRSSEEMDEGLGSGDEIVDGVLQTQKRQMDRIMAMNEEDVD